MGCAFPPRYFHSSAAIITALLDKELTKRQLLSASYVARTQDFDAYVNGIANKSAEEVAFIMCRMKYLYLGYCHQFDSVGRIGGPDEQYRGRTTTIYGRFDGGNGYQGYYSGITRDSCREVSGRGAHSLGEMRTVNSWTDFTTTWRTG